MITWGLLLLAFSFSLLLTGSYEGQAEISGFTLLWASLLLALEPAGMCLSGVALIRGSKRLRVWLVAGVVLTAPGSIGFTVAALTRPAPPLLLSVFVGVFCGVPLIILACILYLEPRGDRSE